MNPEIETYNKYVRKQIDDILTALNGLNEEQLNQRPGVDGANSAYVIATHVLGNARAWVLGIACGQPLSRDRPAEFASSGSHESLDKAATALFSEMDQAVGKLNPATLGDRFVPRQELWGEGEPHEIARREAFAHVIEHAAMHLGQIHLTRDLVSKR
jgi:uncharacterized damage-inducible protein DinB